mgnify:CR=1 FL=1
MQKDTIIYIGAPDITTRSRAHAGSGIRTALGALVIEDIVGIFMLIILTAISASKEVSGIELVGEIGMMLRR